MHAYFVCGKGLFMLVCTGDLCLHAGRVSASVLCPVSFVFCPLSSVLCPLFRAVLSCPILSVCLSVLCVCITIDTSLHVRGAQESVLVCVRYVSLRWVVCVVCVHVLGGAKGA
jgi:hypothetical protein